MIQEIEKKFLSLLFKKPEHIPKAMTNIGDDEFTTPQAVWLYQIICDHYLKFGTAMTKTVLKTILSEKLQGDMYDEQLIYCKVVSKADPFDKDFEFYVDRLKNGRTYRQILTTLDRVATDINPSNALSQVERLEEKIAQIRSNNQTAGVKEHDFSENVIPRLANYEQSEENLTKVPTPIKELNDTIGGMKKTHLIIIAAPSSEGKSVLLLNFANHANKLGHNVVYVTLEMPYSDIEDRYHSLVTGIDSKKIANRLLDTAEKKKFFYRLLKRQVIKEDEGKLREIFRKDPIALGVEPTKEETKVFGEKAGEKAKERLVIQVRDLHFRPSKFFVIDSLEGMNIAKLRSHLRNLTNRCPIDLVVIDYLNLLESGIRGLKNWEDAMNVAKQLKQIAREFRFPILTAAQLHIGDGDGGKGVGKRLTQEDMRYSKAINENADHVIAFRRSEKDKLMGVIRLELIKHRHSEPKTIAVREKFKTMGIENLIEVG